VTEQLTAMERQVLAMALADEPAAVLREHREQVQFLARRGLIRWHEPLYGSPGYVVTRKGREVLRQSNEPAPRPPDRSLLGAAARVRQFTGHIEDLGDDERVFLLGALAGGAEKLRGAVREQYASAHVSWQREALPFLAGIAATMGDTEFAAWAAGLEERND
jgi:hypothetical protein